MPIIRVDDEVYSWLQTQAKPFEDTPNSVLRRVAGLDMENTRQDASTAGHLTAPPPDSEVPSRSKRSDRHVMYGLRNPEIRERLTGELLRKRWKVPVRHALYHQGGTFYENLQHFPGALFDPAGYVVFKTAAEYRQSPYLHIGQKLNVPRGISAIPGYIRKA